MKNDFFVSQLTWDGIIAVIGVVLGGMALVSPFLWRQWRKAHPLRVQFSRDSYDWHGQAHRERSSTPRWRLPPNSGGQLLLWISPHTNFNLRRVRVKFVERKWLSRGGLWKWVTADTAVIKGEYLRDPFRETAPSPLYYFDTKTDDPPDGSFLQGEFFDDHDSSKGKDISQGDIIWLGIHVRETGPWKGRLEIEMPVNGKRVFERKRIEVTRILKSDMANFQILEAEQSCPETTKDCPSIA